MMSPDINSLPPSHAPSSLQPLQPRSSSSEATQARSSSPRPSSLSILNPSDMPHRASFSNRSPRSSRPSMSEHSRRIGLNDPGGLTGSGEFHGGDHRSSIGYSFRTASPTSLGGSPTIATGDPHHQRTPSLGEIHQELEQEQEAQVNRLLQMIRSQQVQLQQMQQQQQQHHQQQPQQQPPHQHAQQQQHQLSTSGTAIIDDWTPTSERSVSYSPVQPLHNPARSSAIDPAHASHGSEWSILTGSEVGARRGSRDESAFYQAEAAMLSRENQMLRLRIRELERQINDSQQAAPTNPTPSEVAAGTNCSEQSNIENSEPSTSSMADPISEEAEKT